MPPVQDGSVERLVEIRNEEGLHMRPAMGYVDCANSFASRISVSKGAQCVDGKSIMQMTMLAATKGTQLKISAIGADAEEAAVALAKLLEAPKPENVG